MEPRALSCAAAAKPVMLEIIGFAGRFAFTRRGGNADNWVPNYIGTPPRHMPQQANQPLPAGYVLNGFRIEKPLSSGGFSIVYLARDEKDTPYAIKEYLPSSLPLRAEGVEIVIDEANLAIFRHGLKCFFEEGR